MVHRSRDCFPVTERCIYTAPVLRSPVPWKKFIDIDAINIRIGGKTTAHTFIPRSKVKEVMVEMHVAISRGKHPQGPDTLLLVAHKGRRPEMITVTPVPLAEVPDPEVGA